MSDRRRGEPDPSRAVMERLRGLPGAETVEFPPPVFRQLGGRITGFEPGRAIEARWPVLEWERGPEGAMQGGLLIAAVDNTFGPLAYLVAGGPVATIGLHASFVRPVGADQRWITIRATVDGRTRRVVFMSARVTGSGDRLLARVTTELAILDPNRWSAPKEERDIS